MTPVEWAALVLFAPLLLSIGGVFAWVTFLAVLYPLATLEDLWYKWVVLR